MSYQFLDTIWRENAKKVTIPTFLHAAGKSLSQRRATALGSKNGRDAAEYLNCLDGFTEAYLWLVGHSGAVFTPLREDAEALLTNEHRRFPAAAAVLLSESPTPDSTFEALSNECAIAGNEVIPDWAQDPFSQTERLGVLPTVTDLLNLRTEKATLVRVGRFR
jgi:hypothetical protein